MRGNRDTVEIVGEKESLNEHRRGGPLRVKASVLDRGQGMSREAAGGKRVCFSTREHYE